MKPSVEQKCIITVPEATEYYVLNHKKFRELLHQGNLNFLVYYYNGRRLIIREEFEKYLDKHPELRRRKRNGK